MKKRVSLLLTIATILINACNAPNKSEATKSANTIVKIIGDVPFKAANNYFVKNTYKDGELENPKITNQTDFENIFGMATTMGESGKPTLIDFSKEYVIAIIGAVSNKANTISIKSIKKTANRIELTYTETKGDIQSYSTRPFDLIIVNNQYDGAIKFIKQ